MRNSAGEIKEIRETPNKKSHRFIEFYDVQDAQNAMTGLNEVTLFNKIKIEAARPWGEATRVGLDYYGIQKYSRVRCRC